MKPQFLLCYPSARYTSLPTGGTPHGRCFFVVVYEGQGERMPCRVVSYVVDIIDASQERWDVPHILLQSV